jgi:putative addiction module component (TIGR02574 family)
LDLAAFGIDKFDDEERLLLVTALWDNLRSAPADCPEFMKYVQAHGLSVDEKIELAGETWGSIPPDSPALKPTPELMEELERRLAEVEVHPEDGIPWEQVKAELRQAASPPFLTLATPPISSRVCKIPMIIR